MIPKVNPSAISILLLSCNLPFSPYRPFNVKSCISYILLRLYWVHFFAGRSGKLTVCTIRPWTRHSSVGHFPFTLIWQELYVYPPVSHSLIFLLFFYLLSLLLLLSTWTPKEKTKKLDGPKRLVLACWPWKEPKRPAVVIVFKLLPKGIKNRRAREFRKKKTETILTLRRGYICCPVKLCSFLNLVKTIFFFLIQMKL